MTHTQTQQAGLSRHAFMNAVRILMNIDKHELEGAGVLKPNQVGGSDWTRFNKDPLMFMAKLPDDRMDSLWGLIQSRQPENYRTHTN